MKIFLSNKKERGMILVIALVILGLLGLTLIATLDMVSSQRQIIASSQGWNSVIPVCEAGVEDAMAHINYTGTTNLASDGWTYSGTNYSRTYTLKSGYYSVTISTSTPPIIVSQGFMQAPVQTNYISRTVQVNTRQNGLFPDAILVKNAISMSGGSIINSFNSSTTTYSTSGQYDSTKSEATANVYTVSGGTAIIAVGTGKIYGDVDTGPAGTITVGSSGAVGTNSAWVNNAANGGSIEAGCSAANVNTIIPDVVLPNMAGALTPASGAIGSTNYTFVLRGGNYILNPANGGDNLNIGGGNSIGVSLPSVLYITNNNQFTVGGSGYIYIAPGASLQLYVASPTCTLSGSGVVNGTQNATNFGLWCMPNCTTLTASGSSTFIGTMYAPEADMTFSGSADSDGAFVGKSMTITGGGNIHYDAALGGPIGYKYLAASWQEL